MISAVVLTKNEEKNIGACLATLKWVDEIIVVDDESTDKTVRIVQQIEKAKIFPRKLGDDFGGQRNFGLEKASHSWVFFVDADERITPELAKEIQTVIKKDEFDGFFLKRRDILYGRELQHGETAKVRLVRLVKKGTGEWVGRVHERYEGSASWRREKWGKLENPLIHYPHQNLTEFLTEINFYSTLRAKELFDQGVRSSLGQIIFYPVGKFIYLWLILGGCLDGMPGMVMAVMMSFHTFLTRAKLYLLTKKS